MSGPELIALFGPTGVGKTAVAIALADGLRDRGENPVAVSADALQIYAGLEILTGAATAGEQARLEHRLVSCIPVTESFSAGRYAELAHAEIDALAQAGRRPILVGGTGLYLRAALTRLDLHPPVDPQLRAALSGRLEREGPTALHAELLRTSPQAGARIAPTDPQRITRALELLAVGRDPSRAVDQLWTDEMRRPTHLFGLTMEREALYAGIDRRVAAMVAAGAAGEVAAAAAAGAGPSARKAVGFRELLTGPDDTVDAGSAVEAMARHTRQYARRQLTWMRKLADVTLLDVTHATPEATAARILADLDRSMIDSTA